MISRVADHSPWGPADIAATYQALGIHSMSGSPDGLRTTAADSGSRQVIAGLLIDRAAAQS